MTLLSLLKRLFSEV